MITGLSTRFIKESNKNLLLPHFLHPGEAAAQFIILEKILLFSSYIPFTKSIQHFSQNLEKLTFDIIAVLQYNCKNTICILHEGVLYARPEYRQIYPARICEDPGI